MQPNCPSTEEWIKTMWYVYTKGFPGGWAGKESTCNEGDLGSIPGLGRSPGKGKGYPLQYSCLENSMDRGTWQATVHGVAKSWIQLSDFTFTFHFHALEKAMATLSSVLAWRIPGTEELLSMGWHRVGHKWHDLAAAAAYPYILYLWHMTKRKFMHPEIIGFWMKSQFPDSCKDWRKNADFHIFYDKPSVG